MMLASDREQGDRHPGPGHPSPVLSPAPVTQGSVLFEIIGVQSGARKQIETLHRVLATEDSSGHGS